MIRPKIVKSVHYCPNTNKSLERRYHDMTSFNGAPTALVYPKQDENKNPLETEYGLSVYKDHQTFTMQELPESAPPGQLPRFVDVIADNDLADKSGFALFKCFLFIFSWLHAAICRVRPGDRVRVIGVYRCMPSKQQGYTGGIFRTVIVANNIQLMAKDANIDTTQEDVSNARKLAKNKVI